MRQLQNIIDIGNAMKKNHGIPYQKAYEAWFSDYEKARRARGARRGAKIPDFPEAPTSPEQIAAAVETIGARRVLSVLEIHRSTLARWLAGSSVIPRPAWLLLSMMAEGRLPGMSSDWRDFRFVGDTLVQIGTPYAYTARDIAGWHYQAAHLAAQERQIADLQKKIADLLRVGDFGAANDPIISSA